MELNIGENEDDPVFFVSDLLIHLGKVPCCPFLITCRPGPHRTFAAWTAAAMHGRPTGYLYLPPEIPWTVS